MGVSSDKDRELGEAQAEIKALKLSERLREKAVEEVISSPRLSFVFYIAILVAMKLCRQFYVCSYGLR